MNVAVIGTGLFPFGYYPEKSMEEMAFSVLKQALSEAGISANQVEMGYFSNVLAARLMDRLTLGQVMFDQLGIRGIPIVNVENACASGSTAIHEAAWAISTGRCEVAAVLGVEKISGTGLGIITSGNQELEGRLGFAMPGLFALKAKRYFYEFGGRPEDLALVSVKNYKFGAENPVALVKKSVTVEDVMHSPIIADPLTRLQCCAMPDGAACIILASERFAKRNGLSVSKKVSLKASVLITGEYKNPPNIAFWESDQRASQLAYEQAGVQPSDIDLVEAHDAFTISEVMHYEGLGFCPQGQGIELLQNGDTSLGGRIPFNTSGGLLGRGHALGATGIAQTIEIVHQLQRRSGSRQVEQARVGLTHCMGGDQSGDAKATVVQIYSS
jgi:acetyl-CoA acetyltransferase